MDCFAHQTKNISILSNLKTDDSLFEKRVKIEKWSKPQANMETGERQMQALLVLQERKGQHPLTHSSLDHYWFNTASQNKCNYNNIMF